ncbi:CHAT domain-containing protein [Lentzea sp. NPDC034063]|uniref:CHAT domain-containing protein n=1 Tax=unclassified Lentzea TaxID=2643253 RepID=UPI003404F6B1
MGLRDKWREATRRRTEARREELFASLIALLEATEATRNFELVLRPGVARDAKELRRLFDENDPPEVAWKTLRLLGWLHWYRYNGLPVPDGREALDFALQAFTFCFLVGLETPGVLASELADRVTAEAIELFERAREGSADEEQLDDLVALWTRIVDGTPDNSTRPGRLWHLSRSLLIRYGRTGNQTDLDEAVDRGRESVRISPGDSRFDLVGRLASLAEALLLTSQHAPDGLAVLTESIDAGEQALEIADDGHPDRPGVLVDLAYAWNARSLLTGRADDLDRAVGIASAAAEVLPDGGERTLVLTNLCNRLIVRSGRTGGLADLDEAVRVGRVAVESGGDHDDLAMARSNLAGALRARSERTGAIDDLHEAIRVAGEAVTAARAANVNAGMYLSNLAGVIQARFERTGALGDLDGAVEAGRDAVVAAEGLRGDDIGDLALYLSNLGGTLRIRSSRAEDAEELARYLDEAITVGRRAVETAADDHPRRPLMLTNLGGALMTRHRLHQDAEDLDEAIDVCREATALAGDGHPDQAMTNANLSQMLQARYEENGDATSLDEAIAAARLATTVIPPDHPDRAKYLFMLGSGLEARSDAGKEARHAFEAAVAIPGGAPSVRIRAARAAAALSVPDDPAKAATLEAAVLLLFELTPQYLRRADRQVAIAETAGLANDAAAAVLTSAPDGAMRALGLLEAGRAVLLSQSLQTRSDLTDLRAARADLAARFVELRNRLDQDATAIEIGQRPDSRADLPGELAAVLDQIRALDGFGSFGLAPAAGELMPEAAHGPVVTFNITADRSDALLLTADGVRLLPLPDLDFAALIEQVDTFHQALRQTTDRDADRAGAQRTLAAVLGWLWDVAAGPVLAALGFDSSPTDCWPRVWWVPGGLLGLLPLHASGYHGDSSRRTVIDRVVSSYTPTIRALHHARQAGNAVGPSRSLIVAMPTTPGLPRDGRLRHVSDEAHLVNDLLPEPLLLVEGEDTPTTSRVLTELASRAVAHFACHGTHDATDPSQSRLLLHDHLTTPLTVASLATISLDHARLAYLSACETALNTSGHLLDEAIHLTSAFQLAGFPHVIGTLWALDDEIAVEIAEDFYRGLPADRPTSRAAFALHDAVRRQRDRYPATPSLWAGHIHAGA